MNYPLRKPTLMFVQVGVPCELVNDSHRLLLEHFDAISNSPSHIYHSALPFSPSSSRLRSYYSAELSQEVKVVKGLPAEWGMCSRTVPLHYHPLAFACRRDIVAIGLQSGDIITLDGITGSRAATLSGRTGPVESLAFSPDGASLVSGGGKVVKLWDMQTGGVIKPFHGHNDRILSVSVSADHTIIASGSEDKTILLWTIQTGESCCIIKPQSWVSCVSFSPTDPLHLISASGGMVQQWDIAGREVNSPHRGSHVSFSPDGTQFVSCHGAVVEVRESASGEFVTKCDAPSGNTNYCCFSPDGSLIAVSTGTTVFVWKFAVDPCTIETFDEHTGLINSLAFSSPSSLISSSQDQSIKFWQIGTLSTDPVVIDQESAPIPPAPTKSITLQAGDGIAISSDSTGVVKTWDISTGDHKENFQTPAKGPHQSDVRLIDGIPVFVWQMDTKIHIQYLKQDKPILTVDGPGTDIESVRISGDGSKVFCLHQGFIHAWSMWDGEYIDKVGVEISGPKKYLTVDGSKLWVHSSSLESQGWDFGIPDLKHVQLRNMTALYLNSTKMWDIGQSRIEEIETGRVVFQLPVRFVKYVNAQWDGGYFVVLCESGEVLILDFNSIL